MRKLLSLIVLAVFLVMPILAQAASVTATMGDQNSSFAYRISCTDDGVCTFASDTGIMYPYENYTSPNTPNTILATETGKTIRDTGGSTTGSCNSGNGGSKHTLPTAVAGMEFTIEMGSKCQSTVDVQSADVIDYSISGTLLDAGDSIKSTGQAGDSVTLKSEVAGHWSIKSMKGVWTDNGTS